MTWLLDKNLRITPIHDKVIHTRTRNEKLKLVNKKKKKRKTAQYFLIKHLLQEPFVTVQLTEKKFDICHFARVLFVFLN